MTRPLPNVSAPALRKNNRSFPMAEPFATGPSGATVNIVVAEGLRGRMTPQ
jgi:hypothetical protein